MAYLNKSLVLACAFTVVGAPALAAPMCALVKPAAIEALLGAKLASKEEYKGYVAEGCSYMTVAGAGGPQMLMIERYTIALPPGSKHYGMMRLGSDDKIVEVKGLGDHAVMNEATHEMVMHSGGVVYHFDTRGMYCDDESDRTDIARNACNAKRTAALSQIARLILGRR